MGEGHLSGKALLIVQMKSADANGEILFDLEAGHFPLDWSSRPASMLSPRRKAEGAPAPALADEIAHADEAVEDGDDVDYGGGHDGEGDPLRHVARARGWESVLSSFGGGLAGHPRFEA